MKFPLQLQYELTLDDTRKVFDLSLIHISTR